jgi:ectoine hydroxylase-related dioxygenase (phytanoyl-CoA dioxygenase family)
MARAFGAPAASLRSRADGLPLGSGAREAFWRDGFLVLRGLAPPGDLADIRRALTALYERFADLPAHQIVDLGAQASGRSDAQIPEINWTIRLVPSLAHSLAFARCRAIAEALLGRSVAHTGYDHAILKPPHNACATPWHQDEAYAARRGARGTVHFWIPMHEVPVEMGCMHYLPGSHRGPVWPHRPRGGSAAAHALEAVSIDVSTAVACPVAAGDATVHLPRTLHYSGPNTTGYPRLAWILEFGPRPGAWTIVRRALGRLL